MQPKDNPVEKGYTKERSMVGERVSTTEKRLRTPLTATKEASRTKDLVGSTVAGKKDEEDE